MARDDEQQNDTTMMSQTTVTISSLSTLRGKYRTRPFFASFGWRLFRDELCSLNLVINGNLNTAQLLPRKAVGGKSGNAGPSLAGNVRECGAGKVMLFSGRVPQEIKNL